MICLVFVFEDCTAHLESDMFLSRSSSVSLVLPRCGGKDLKASGTYPLDFGREVCNLHVQAMVACQD